MKEHLTEEERDEKIRAAIEKMLGDRKPRTLSLLDMVSYISVNEPGKHDSREHLAKDREALNELQSAILVLEKAIRNLPDDQREGIEFVANRILRDESHSPAKIASMEGFFAAQIGILDKMIWAVWPEMKRLWNEKAARYGAAVKTKNYWHYAIAMNLAELYVRELGKIPTCSMKAAGFGWALEEIFRACGSGVKARGPAKIAIKAVKDAGIVTAISA
jgi:hypothetical protein